MGKYINEYLDGDAMSFYDHFTQKEKLPTQIGMNLVRRANIKILNLLKKIKNYEDVCILEIGPGRGVFAELCQKNNVKYTAIEVNLILSNDLKKRGFKIINSKVPPISLASDKFDIVYMNQVFEHMNNIEMAQELIEECHRVLKEDGILCIISPDYLACKEDFFDCDYTHNYITTVRRLKEIYYDHNIDIIYENYVSGPFFGGVVTFLLSCIGRLFIRPQLIHLLTFGLISEERIYKIRLTILRSFIIIGKKR